MNLRLPILLAASALLAACGGGGNAQREEGGAGEAEGEVLGGSISDEMLPLDTVKSQSPPLKASPAARANGEAAVEETSAAEAAEPAQPAAPITSQVSDAEG